MVAACCMDSTQLVHLSRVHASAMRQLCLPGAHFCGALLCDDAWVKAYAETVYLSAAQKHSSHRSGRAGDIVGAWMCTGVLVTGNCCGLCSKGHICAPREAAAYQHLLPHQQSVSKQQKDVTAAQGSSTHVSFLEQGACRAVAIAAIKHALVQTSLLLFCRVLRVEQGAHSPSLSAASLLQRQQDRNAAEAASSPGSQSTGDCLAWSCLRTSK